MFGITIRAVAPGERDWVEAWVRERWGDASVIAHGVRFYPHDLPGLVVLRGGERVGLVTYHIAKRACEIVTIDSLYPGQGIGTALIEGMVQVARQAGCERVWLVTTNDNLDALAFYQKRGFVLSGLHPDALAQSRRLKPQIPFTGAHDIPLRDEIELQRAISKPARVWWGGSDLWCRVLWAVSVAGCVGGVVLALLAALVPAVLTSIYGYLDPGSTGDLSPVAGVMVTVALGIGGGLQAGASAIIAYMARHPLRRGETWAWRACVLGLGLWLALDTGLTAWYAFNGYPGLWPKIVNDLCFVVMFGLPYAALYRHCHGEA
jgi:GNAT superfamily N-acetyltransferase